jgi:hypothetical protein
MERTSAGRHLAEGRKPSGSRSGSRAADAMYEGAHNHDPSHNAS